MVRFSDLIDESQAEQVTPKHSEAIAKRTGMDPESVLALIDHGVGLGLGRFRTGHIVQAAVEAIPGVDLYWLITQCAECDRARTAVREALLIGIEAGHVRCEGRPEDLSTVELSLILAWGMGNKAATIERLHVERRQLIKRIGRSM